MTAGPEGTATWVISVFGAPFRTDSCSLLMICADCGQPKMCTLAWGTLAVAGP